MSQRQSLLLEHFVNANNLEKQGKDKEALDEFRCAIESIVGAEFLREVMPLASKHDGRSEVYLKLDPESAVSLLRLVVRVGRCLTRLRKRVEAISWFREVFVIDQNLKYNQVPFFDYEEKYSGSRPASLQYIQTLVNAHDELCTAFLLFCNTSLAIHHTFIAQTLVESPPAGGRIRPGQLQRTSAAFPTDGRLTQMRHPEPKFIDTLKVTFESLQTRGIWEKLAPKEKTPKAGRFGGVTFLWNSHLYVLAGEKKSDWTPVDVLHGREVSHDFWCINLQELDTWRKLPSIPAKYYKEGFVIKAGIWKDRAYIFSGSSQMCYFDLVSETWTQISTSGKLRYPQNGVTIQDFSTTIARGKLYVFGGRYESCFRGSDLFHALDLETLEWKHISGSPQAQAAPPSWDQPGPRKRAMMWTNHDESSIFLMFGDVDFIPHIHTSHLPESHAYDDLWIYDIETNLWRREILKGSYPCPRSEMGITTNPVLRKTIAFGGYSPSIPTASPERKVTYAYSYYADTFLLDDSNPSSIKWKHVLTRSFPTYRAQPQLLSDPATGHIYLFGGYSNPDYLDLNKNYTVRFHSDLWRLKLDIEQGEFDEANWEDESRTTRAGPWQRCFACGSTGQWKKCGGSCGGTVYFCNQQCLKDGWKEHKVGVAIIIRS